METHTTILRPKDVAQALGLSLPTLYRRIRQKLFPEPILHGGNMSIWPSDWVHAYNEAVVSGATDEELQALTVHLTKKAKLRMPKLMSR